MYLVIIAAILSTIPLSIIYASVFEWTLHKYVLHIRQRFLTFPYVAHAITHHGLFKADASYYTRDEHSKKKIMMAPWAGPVIVAIGTLLYATTLIPLLWLGYSQIALAIAITSTLVFASYFGAYEYMHYCYHDPKWRLVERFGFFQWLKSHHRQHHKNWRTNLNTVIPIADWCFGTLRPGVRPATE